MTQHFPRFPPSQFFTMDAYKPGCKLTFERVDRAAGDADSETAGLGGRVELEIVQRIFVGFSRRSQILLVSTCIPNSEAEIFVAKCFDPSFCCTSEAADFFQNPVQYCKSRSLVETEAYQRLSVFQGQHVPNFYGRYRYSTDSGDATAILLEYIRDPSLDRHNQLCETELLQIFDIGNAALGDIHSRGVYHYDIQPSNLFWNSDTKALRIVDWKFSLFDRPADEAQDWAKGDRSEFRTALEACGLPEMVIEISKNAMWVWQSSYNLFINMYN